MGEWEEVDGFPGRKAPVGGMAYYITPPSSLSNVFMDPYHSVFYLAFVMMGCAIFSKAWMEVSGASSQVIIPIEEPFLTLQWFLSLDTDITSGSMAIVIVGLRRMVCPLPLFGLYRSGCEVLRWINGRVPGELMFVSIRAVGRTCCSGIERIKMLTL